MTFSMKIQETYEDGITEGLRRFALYLKSNGSSDEEIANALQVPLPDVCMYLTAEENQQYS